MTLARFADVIAHRNCPSLVASAAAALALCAAAATSLHAEPLITEFMASNTTTLVDQDQAFSDWIEVHNPDATPVTLTGWYLTDTAANKTRWQFPAVTIPAGGYLVVFASNKNRREAGGELHTNFALGAEGEYLALVKPDGTSVAYEYAPTYPAQSNDIAYGLLPSTGGGWRAAYLPSPTPGAANNPAGAATLAATVRFSRPGGPFTAPFDLELAGAGAGQHIRYSIVAPSPAGPLASEPTAASPRYEGPMRITAQTVIRAAVFSDDLQQRGLSSVEQFFGLAVEGPRHLADFAGRHPVLVIEQHGFGGLDKADGVQPSWLYGFAAPRAGGSTFGVAPEFVSPIALAVRGSSSADFPKKSYNIETLNDLRRDTARSLFGSRPFDKWALVGPWHYDPSYLRNSFIYALSNRIGRWAPRTQFVEVFLNTSGQPLDTSAYVGVYALTDKIDIHPDRVAIARMSALATNEPEISGGYLLKIDQPDPDEFSWTTDQGLDIDTLSSVVVASPKAPRLSNAQRTYIRGYVQQMENALHADRASGWRTRTYLNFIDRPSWVDHHILNTFAANPDAFERSAYFHKPRGGKLLAGPVWDFDRSLGSYWDERSFRWDVWYGENAVQPWHFAWWGILATDPDFRQDWVDRWQALRREAFGDANLTGLADQLAASLGPEAAARDAAQWVDSVSGFGGTHAGEMAHLKDWLVKRAGWIDEQFVAAPTLAPAGAEIALTPVGGIPVAYTLDGSDPRAVGGDVAPNALMTAVRITVPASANLHARSYRAEARDAFPGTPWSSAVATAGASPLTPASRIVNLSSRAGVGSGERALIMGVVVADTAEKRYLSRAVGPALTAFGVTDPVRDPQLTVFAEGGRELARNNGWSTGPDATAMVPLARNAGAFALPAGSADSALITPLGSGAYTLQITTPGGQGGLALAELYELDGRGRTVNLSTRAQVGSGDRTLIGGFVVAGTAYKRMLIRAVGPSLRNFGVTDALADPVLTVYAGPTPLATNDRWSSTNATMIAAAATRVGAFNLAPDTEDAALLITVPPGAYTAELRGKADTTGVALLEIYEVQ